MRPRFAGYLVQRILRAGLTVFGVVNLAFLLIRVVPGDPADVILGDLASPTERADWRAARGLDQPLWAQWSSFVIAAAQGDLGASWVRDQPVSTMVLEVMPATIALAAGALSIAWCMGLALGVVAAYRREGTWDHLASGAAVLGLAIPNIWLGPLLILAFGVELRWLPLPGDENAGLQGLILPSLTVGVALAAILTRQTRGALVEVLQQPYVVAARARGLSDVAVLGRHALRNALLPVLTVGAAQVGALLTGAVIAEKIFERPGIGTLLLDGFFSRDLPTVQGCVVVMGVVYVGANVAVDVLYGWIDPRVRLS